MNRSWYVLALLLAAVAASCRHANDHHPADAVALGDPVVPSRKAHKENPERLPTGSASRSLPVGVVQRAAEIGVSQIEKSGDEGPAQEGTRLKIDSETVKMLGVDQGDRRLKWEADVEVNGSGEAVEIKDVGLTRDRLSVSHSITTDQINVKWKTDF